MTTANKITLIRICMIPFFIVFALMDGPVNHTVALVLFCVASFTDFLDGYIARKYNQVTDFGKFVDPLADKLLVTAALVIFVQNALLTSWMVFIILAREFIITSLRNVAAAKGRVLAAAWSGKVKTCVQIAGIIVIFITDIVAGLRPLENAARIYMVCGWIMTLMTLYSGIDYMAKNWEIVKDGASRPEK